MEFTDDMKVVSRGGENLVSHKPFFTWDSKYLLLICGSKVKVFSLKGTGCVQVLEGHQKQITCLCQNPLNRFQVITSSLDGMMKCWSYEGGVELWSFKGHLSIHFLYLCPLVTEKEMKRDQGDDKMEVTKMLKEDDDMSEKSDKKEVSDGDAALRNYEGDEDVNAYAVVSHKDKPTEYSLVKMCLNTHDNGEDNTGEWEEVIDLFTSSKKLFQIGNNSTMFTHDTSNGFRVHNLLTNKSFKHKTPSRHHLASFSVHPSLPNVAVGMSNGSIVLYNNTLCPHPILTTLHWHALLLPALSFTSDGSSLLSGGHECVLVAWSMSTNHKRLLPRLLSPILHISSNHDASLFALSHIDNGIQIVSNTWNILQCIQGLCRSSTTTSSSSSNTTLPHVSPGDDDDGGGGNDFCDVEDGGGGGNDDDHNLKKENKIKNNNKQNGNNIKDANVNNNDVTMVENGVEDVVKDEVEMVEDDMGDVGMVVEDGVKIVVDDGVGMVVNDGVGMVVDGKAGLLVMRGFHGKLQFYDVINDTHAYSVDITLENHISPESLSRPVSMTYIDHVSLSEGCDWLLTGESLTYEDGEVAEMYVKFWQRKSDGGYTLTTSAKDPHKAKSIASVSKNCNHTAHPFFVTMATIKKSSFIIWKMSDDEHGKGHGHWQGVFVGSYNNLLPTHISLNLSALAVVYDKRHVTFWDPVSLRMSNKIDTAKNLTSVLFVGETDCMFLSTPHQLIFWSPILKDQWQTPLKITCMITTDDVLITFTTSLHIKVFKSNSSQPIRSYPLNSCHPITDACFLNKKLYFFNTRQQLLTLTNTSSQTKAQIQTASHDTKNPFLPSPLSTTHNPFSTTPSPIPSNNRLTQQFLAYLRDTPSHLIAPTKTWGLQYITTLLQE